MSMHRSFLSILAVLPLASAAAVTTPLAGNGDVPVYQATAITAPGRYIVTRDISAQGNVILIQSGGVTLDLNGHTLTSATGTGVVVDMTGAAITAGITVANGRIAGGDSGIKGVNLPAVMTLVIEKVGIVMPMFDCIDVPGTGRVEVRGSNLRECGRDGIRRIGATGGVLHVDDTFITHVQANGILASGLDGVTVRRSTVRRFGLGLGPNDEAGGVRLSFPGKLGLSVSESVMCDGSTKSAGLLLELGGAPAPIDVTGSTIGGNGGSGIDVRQGAARITGNTIAGNLADGLRVDSAGIVTPTMISGNSLLDNTLNGADIRAGVARFNGNTVGGNLLDGVRVSGERALVESNFLEGNGGVGLRFLNGTGHAYRTNFLRGNTGGPIQDQFGNTDAGGNIP